MKIRARWIIFLTFLIIIAPFIGFLKDLFGSVEPLEHVAERLGLSEKVIYRAPFPDYAVPSIKNDYVSSLLASLIGFVTIFVLANLVGKILVKRKRV